MMNLKEAKAECERWFAYLESQKERSLQFQKLAAKRRKGEIGLEEARRIQRNLDNSIRVFDGAKLEIAVKTLLKHVKE